MRNLGGLIAIVAALVLPLAACGSDDDSSAPVEQTIGPAPKGAGPLFDECAKITPADLAAADPSFSGMTPFITNPSVCEWRQGYMTYPRASWNWYRGSPIDRERAHEQLDRDFVRNISIAGNSGWEAASAPGLGGGICEVAIAFGRDFFEISMAWGQQQNPLTDDQMCTAVRKIAELAIRRAQ